MKSLVLILAFQAVNYQFHLPGQSSLTPPFQAQPFPSPVIVTCLPFIFFSKHHPNPSLHPIFALIILKLSTRTCSLQLFCYRQQSESFWNANLTQSSLLPRTTCSVLEGLGTNSSLELTMLLIFTLPMPCRLWNMPLILVVLFGSVPLHLLFPPLEFSHIYHFGSNSTFSQAPTKFQLLRKSFPLLWNQF